MHATKEQCPTDVSCKRDDGDDEGDDDGDDGGDVMK